MLSECCLKCCEVPFSACGAVLSQRDERCFHVLFQVCALLFILPCAFVPDQALYPPSSSSCHWLVILIFSPVCLSLTCLVVSARLVVFLLIKSYRVFGLVWSGQVSPRLFLSFCASYVCFCIMDLTPTMDFVFLGFH